MTNKSPEQKFPTSEPGLKEKSAESTAEIPKQRTAQEIMHEAVSRKKFDADAFRKNVESWTPDQLQSMHDRTEKFAKLYAPENAGERKKILEAMQQGGMVTENIAKAIEAAQRNETDPGIANQFRENYEKIAGALEEAQKKRAPEASNPPETGSVNEPKSPAEENLTRDVGAEERAAAMQAASETEKLVEAIKELNESKQAHAITLEIQANMERNLFESAGINAKALQVEVMENIEGKAARPIQKLVESFQFAQSPEEARVQIKLLEQLSERKQVEIPSEGLTALRTLEALSDDRLKNTLTLMRQTAIYENLKNAEEQRIKLQEQQMNDKKFLTSETTIPATARIESAENKFSPDDTVQMEKPE